MASDDKGGKPSFDSTVILTEEDKEAAVNAAKLDAQIAARKAATRAAVQGTMPIDGHIKLDPDAALPFLQRPATPPPKLTEEELTADQPMDLSSTVAMSGEAAMSGDPTDTVDLEDTVTKTGQEAPMESPFDIAPPQSSRPPAHLPGAPWSNEESAATVPTSDLSSTMAISSDVPDPAIAAMRAKIDAEEEAKRAAEEQAAAAKLAEEKRLAEEARLEAEQRRKQEAEAFAEQQRQAEAAEKARREERTEQKSKEAKKLRQNMYGGFGSKS